MSLNRIFSHLAKDTKNKQTGITNGSNNKINIIFCSIVRKTEEIHILGQNRFQALSAIMSQMYFINITYKLHVTVKEKEYTNSKQLDRRIH